MASGGKVLNITGLKPPQSDECHSAYLPRQCPVQQWGCLPPLEGSKNESDHSWLMVIHYCGTGSITTQHTGQTSLCLYCDTLQVHVQWQWGKWPVFSPESIVNGCKSGRAAVHGRTWWSWLMVFFCTSTWWTRELLLSSSSSSSWSLLLSGNLCMVPIHSSRASRFYSLSQNSDWCDHNLFWPGERCGFEFRLR